MRCPACDADNPEGATACTSCGKSIPQAAEPTSAPGPVAAPPSRKRLSRLAVFALLAAALAPTLQVQRDFAGGPLLLRFTGPSYLLLMGLDTAANVLFVAAVIASIVALAQVILRPDLRGGALAVAGLLLAVGGVVGGTYAALMRGQAGVLLRAMGGGAGVYIWQTTVIVLAAAVVCEIVLAFVRPRQ